ADFGGQRRGDVPAQVAGQRLFAQLRGLVDRRLGNACPGLQRGGGQGEGEGEQERGEAHGVLHRGASCGSHAPRRKKIRSRKGRNPGGSGPVAQVMPRAAAVALQRLSESRISRSSSTSSDGSAGASSCLRFMRLIA